MTTHDGSTQPKSDFLVAEEIKTILHGREKVEQERIIRWVCESLGIGTAPTRTGGAESVHEQPIVASADSIAASSGAAQRTTDIRSFVQEKQPKSDVQFVAVVAYFYRFMAPPSDRKEAIGSGDLQTAARLAQRAVFKEPSMTLNNSVNQGYLDRAGRGEYQLNAVGENLVAMTLPGTSGGRDTGKRTAGRRSRKPGTKKTRGNKSSGS